MLGRALGREFPEAERFTRSALDITDGGALRAALAPDTRLVLNAAADTRVDAAETDPHHVMVNVVAVGALAALCRKLDAILVHVSTDYVFSGKGIRPYREDDPVDPVNAYGRAKLKPRGVHILRHTLATRLHRRGTGLKAIADVLGHRSLDTTARYARINYGELRQAALPWPRG